MSSMQEKPTHLRDERASSLAADLSLLGVAAIWGFTFPAMQLGLRDLSALTLITLRFSLAALAMLLIFRRRALRFSRAGLGYSMLMGLLLAIAQTLQVIGLHYTTASKSAFITALYVVLIPILVVAVERVRPRASSIAGVVLAIIGLYLITNPSGGINKGDLLTILCSIVFSFYILAADILSPRFDPVPFTFWQIVTAALVSALLLGLTRDYKFVITPWSITTIVTTGLFATVLCYTVQMWAQRATSATHTVIILAAEPACAMLFVWIIQHQVMGPTPLIGGGFILAAILVSQLGAHRGVER